LVINETNKEKLLKFKGVNFFCF